MKWVQKHRGVIVEIICFLFILLFVYAAVSKLLDFENFRVQLGQSPLLTAFAGWVALAVPLMELVSAGMLFVPRLRLWGLYSAFTLMVMFTAYIVIILNFTAFIPCSCGGVLEKLGWREHLVFNLFFVVLSATGILLLKIQERNKVAQYEHHREFLVTRSFTKTTLLHMGLLVLGGVALVSGLFMLSEEKIKRDNSFIRRFPHEPVKKIAELDLGLNSYYIAGIYDDKIYLGNSTAPLHVLILDSDLTNKRTIRLQLEKDSIAFRSVQLKINPPYFYLIDGTIPFILRGDTTNWKAKSILKKPYYFSLAQLSNTNSLIIRTVESKTGDYALAKLTLGNQEKLDFAEGLLQRQGDGIFSSDGTLIFNEDQSKVVYTYYYRNQFIVANDNLELDYRGNTIDTISQAQINVVYLKSKNQSKLATPPLLVNKNTASSGNFLFVQSQLIGRYESLKMWGQASIIDVYDIQKNIYRFSFYIYNLKNEKLRKFYVSDDKFIGLIGTMIVVYNLKEKYFRNN